MLSSSVVTNPRVPRIVRHSLNLESGLNDGLALPAVLAFSAALGADSDFVWWQFVLQDVTLGFAFGVVIGLLASRVLPRGATSSDRSRPTSASLYALGVAFADLRRRRRCRPHGNGLIAVFVCAITLGIRRPDLRRDFEQRADDIVEIVKLGVFVVFGSLLTLDGLFADGWAAVGDRRRHAAGRAHRRRSGSRWRDAASTAPTKAFMAWFGPKGVATMTFSLLVLGDGDPAGRADLQPRRAVRRLLGPRRTG